MTTAVATPLLLFSQSSIQGGIVGLFGKPKSHKITGQFSYIPIRDPRQSPVGLEDTIPAMPGAARTGDEYLQKYLFLVRTEISRGLVQEWLMTCAARIESYQLACPEASDGEEFLGFMAQGFAMAVTEFDSFGIGRADLMADCIWDAMKTFSIQVLIESGQEGQISALAGLLAGYHVAREIQKKNLA